MSQSSIPLVLLYGGRSGEHEISLRSAASVLQYLDKTRYQILPVGIDQAGRCYLNQVEELLVYKVALPVQTASSQCIESLITHGQFAFDNAIVFPVVHGPLYEDGCLQGLLELAGVGYVGCGVLASALGMNKDMARRILSLKGIQSAPYRVLSGLATAKQTESFCQETASTLGWPLFVKPCSMGSSVGIHKVRTMPELRAAVDDARRYDEVVLVEAYIQGREIEVAVLEHELPCTPPHVSLPGEIRVHHEDGFYSYAAKYVDSDATELLVPASLEKGLVTRLQQGASDAFLSLHCQGMARVDFFLNEETNQIYFNEINTIPGFTSISMYPKMWGASGLSYSVLLDRLIDLAVERQAHRVRLVRQYQ